MTNYLELTFIPSLFNDVKYNGEAYSDEERQYIRFNIKKVGQVRFLQKRVNSKSCTSSFSENLGRPLDACFDDYSEEDEFTDDIPFPSHIDSKYSPWFLYDSEESPR